MPSSSKRQARTRPEGRTQAPRTSLPELVAQYPVVALVLQGGGALGAYQCGVY